MLKKKKRNRKSHCIIFKELIRVNEWIISIGHRAKVTLILCVGKDTVQTVPVVLDQVYTHIS